MVCEIREGHITGAYHRGETCRRLWQVFCFGLSDVDDVFVRKDFFRHRQVTKGRQPIVTISPAVSDRVLGKRLFYQLCRLPWVNSAVVLGDGR